MIYILPQNCNRAQELEFPNALNPLKNPLGIKGFLIPSKGMNSTLGFKCKKYGNGTNNSARHTIQRIYNPNRVRV